jgi:hypothetical protein
MAMVFGNSFPCATAGGIIQLNGREINKILLPGASDRQASAICGSQPCLDRSEADGWWLAPISSRGKVGAAFFQGIFFAEL